MLQPRGHRDPAGRGRSRPAALPPGPRCSSAAPSPTRPGARAASRRRSRYINEVTHWWDGSQIYGSDQATQDRLRSGVDGKLRLHRRRHPPARRTSGVEDTGMVRNWWVGRRDAAHALRPRAQRDLRPPQGALPGLGRQPALQRGPPRQRRGHGQDPLHRVDAGDPPEPRPGTWASTPTGTACSRTSSASPGDRRTVADFNVANPELGGLVGNHINKHGKPFGLTEEFVEVYRLHSLLPEELQLRRHDTGDVDRGPAVRGQPPGGLAEGHRARSG